MGYRRSTSWGGQLSSECQLLGPVQEEGFYPVECWSSDAECALHPCQQDIMIDTAERGTQIKQTEQRYLLLVHRDEKVLDDPMQRRFGWMMLRYADCSTGIRLFSCRNPTSRSETNRSTTLERKVSLETGLLFFTSVASKFYLSKAWWWHDAEILVNVPRAKMHCTSSSEMGTDHQCIL